MNKTKPNTTYWVFDIAVHPLVGAWANLDPSSSSLPGFNMVEEVVPALVELLQRAPDLRLLGLVAGQQQLLAKLLQVALVLAEQVDFLHAVLRRAKRRRKTLHL